MIMIPIIILMAIGGCLTITSVIMDFTENKETGSAGSSLIAITGTIAFIFGYVILTTDKNKPSAIDVYRGNTTLEITYRDSIAIDSVVVYKNN